MSGIKTIQQHTYKRKIFNVSELNRRCKQTLESTFSTVWLEGEVSNFAAPASGHWYFSIKDQRAQVRCAMFRGKNQGCKIIPEEGMSILVRAKVSLFEPRGEFQLIVEYLEIAGTGDLLRQYEELKNKLEAEGLFDPDRKKSITPFNRRIGVITSATGAAVHDVISVIRRRYPLQELIIYPCLVQGEQASQQIIRQINTANQRQEVDLLLLVRGGGSLEDLWCFNDESLARAIFASHLPIVSGIGHEVDFTIADFVADLRAPTPSAAAEKTTPDQKELFQKLDSLMLRQKQAIEGKILSHNQQLDWLISRLQSPESIISSRLQQLHLLQHRMKSAFDNQSSTLANRLNNIRLRLSQTDPNLKIQTAKQKHLLLKQRLQQALKNNIADQASQFREMSIRLNSLNPLTILARGYSVTTDDAGNLVTESAQVSVGDNIISKLAKGEIHSQITKATGTKE